MFCSCPNCWASRIHVCRSRCSPACSGGKDCEAAQVLGPIEITYWKRKFHPWMRKRKQRSLFAQLAHPLLLHLLPPNHQHQFWPRSPLADFVVASSSLRIRCQTPSPATQNGDLVATLAPPPALCVRVHLHALLAQAIESSQFWKLCYLEYLISFLWFLFWHS